MLRLLRLTLEAGDGECEEDEEPEGCLERDKDEDASEEAEDEASNGRLDVDEEDVDRCSEDGAAKEDAESEGDSEDEAGGA